MKIFFDTEFIEDGKTIDLMSIGMIREDGAELYLESAECDLSKADDWVKKNVIIHLKGNSVSREEIQRQVIAFCGLSPTFYAYYCNYDWIVLCQLFGKMIDLPSDWPMYCRDLKYLADMMGFEKISYPKQSEIEHNAIADSRWNFELYKLVYNNANNVNFYLDSEAQDLRLEI